MFHLRVLTNTWFIFQAVVEYMSDLVAERNVIAQEVKIKRRGIWSYACSFQTDRV